MDLNNGVALLQNWIVMMLITIVTVAPLRASASHKSEMVSQLLFGELCEQLETSGDFARVRCNYDGYEGWAQLSQVAEIVTNSFDEAQVCKRISEGIVRLNGVPLVLSPGSDLYFAATSRNNVNYETCIAGPHKISYANCGPVKLTTAVSASEVIANAMKFLGTPYLWGGKSAWGIDCSGLVQLSFKMEGMFIPRDAWQQAEGGDAIGFLQESKPGDLAFFDNEEGRIVHVGILLNDHEILHASGQVRMDPIDSHGIIHRETGRRTHSLRIIKRFF
jgi:gamma-D-glutamyl-L-lysine dipeptidyl-peptidase